MSIRGKYWSAVRGVCAAALVSLACGPLIWGDCGSFTKVGGGQQPFPDNWRVEVDAEFPYMVDGEVNISSIGIGGLTSQDNFANRGDVIVKADGLEDRILVKMRRFTWRMNQEDAEWDFENTELLAHTGSLRRPEDIPEENKCGLRDPDDPEKHSPWQDGCSIRLYWNGQIQPVRLGADLRVTLPSSYRHSILVTTDDNDADEDYLNRGDVCVQSLNGTLNAELESGLAYVVFDREATPLPCVADDLQDCTDFGTTKVEASGAANVTIDVPQDLWATFCLDSEGEISVDWPGAVLDPSEPLCTVSGEANRPDDYTPGSEGPYEIRVAVADASIVTYTDEPEDYVGRGNGDEQQSEMRGDIVLCAGCLHPSTCDELLRS